MISGRYAFIADYHPAATIPGAVLCVQQQQRRRRRRWRRLTDRSVRGGDQCLSARAGTGYSSDFIIRSGHAARPRCAIATASFCEQRSRSVHPRRATCEQDNDRHVGAWTRA